ncbi:MAG: hypothetical protein KatS3mg019_0540 [Fimbriimonadales bacterium]|nr:MAG: hypothetical protein KatS3mg019_0540 [Fimbriimonadales bacterium]
MRTGKYPFFPLLHDSSVCPSVAESNRFLVQLLLVDDLIQKLSFLLTRIREGDEQAMDAVLQACRPYLRRYFRTRTRNSEDCEDLVQETLVRISRALPTLELNAPFDHWLYRVAANCLISYYNRVHHHRETVFSQFEDPTSVETLQQDSFETSLLEQIADEQMRARIVQVIKEVCSDAERRVIVMHAQHETLESIAQMLQMNPSTVRSHLMRGRAKVLAHLIQHYPEWLGGAEAIQRAIEQLSQEGDTLSRAELQALQTPKPNQADLRSAALKLAKYLRFH